MRRLSTPDAATIAATMRQRDRAASGPAMADQPEPAGELRLRRWDASQAQSLHGGHWSRVTGASLNEDLIGTLRELRAKCSHEATTNGIVEGMINTYAVDLVGRDGPQLDVISDDPQYDDALEEIWEETADHFDVNGELALAESLQRDVWLWFTKGEHIYIETQDLRADTFAKVRWASVDPQRLDTDQQYSHDGSVSLGVRRSRSGKPLSYYIAELDYSQPFSYALLGQKYEEYSADEVIHQFKRFEPGQIRGVPYLASTLQVAADLRDFDLQVLDAARMAAAQSVYWYSVHDDVPVMAIDTDATQPIRRNQQQIGPPGYQPAMLQSTQPMPQYVEFRLERMRELGRPISMPLMKILLGSERHNFASARMDNQNYLIALGVDRGRLERQTLNRMVNSVAREAALVRRPGRGFILPPRPQRVQYVWTWPAQPHVDPLKEASATKIRMLETRTQTFAAACTELGLDEDKVLASWGKTFKKLSTYGLPETFIGALVASSVAAAEERDEARSLVSVLNRMHHEGLLTPEVADTIHDTLAELSTAG